MTINEIINISPIIPVVKIENLDDAVPLAKALIDGGIEIMELTLRTKVALEAMKIIACEVPQMCIGAGTVCNTQQLEAVKKAGAKFAFSPGISIELIRKAAELDIPFIPGVATASEVMIALNNNIDCCKLFPASLVGGVEILKAFNGPFHSMKFCPTGGINLGNMNDYLSLPNVSCVGGTWIVDSKLIKEKKFDQITSLCKQAIKNIQK